MLGASDTAWLTLNIFFTPFSWALHIVPAPAQIIKCSFGLCTGGGRIYVGEIKAGTVYVYLERVTLPVQV